jgi:hypothetical protein
MPLQPLFDCFSSFLYYRIFKSFYVLFQFYHHGITYLLTYLPGRTYISFCYKLAGGCLYCASRTASFGYNYHQSFIITEKIVLSSARPFYISPLMLNKLLVSTTSLDKCKFSVSHPLFLYLTFIVVLEHSVLSNAVCSYNFLNVKSLLLLNSSIWKLITIRTLQWSLHGTHFR